MKTHLTLEQLENDFWGNPEYDSSLVIKCHQLRKKPIRDFTIEDLRLMIGQAIGLDYLIPTAINHLKNNILAEGDLFEGDLLESVISKKIDDYWKSNKEGLKRILNILENGKHLFTERKIEKINNRIETLNKFK